MCSKAKTGSGEAKGSESKTEWRSGPENPRTPFGRGQSRGGKDLPMFFKITLLEIFYI